MTEWRNATVKNRRRPCVEVPAQDVATLSRRHGGDADAADPWARDHMGGRDQAIWVCGAESMR
jgi:hypothetical protein